MLQVDLNQFQDTVLYDADDIAATLKVHRTFCHRNIFPKIPTVRVGRKDCATGAAIKRHLRGKLDDIEAA